jgi:hypothetical protein
MSGCVAVQGKASEEQAAVQEKLVALQSRNKELEEQQAATKVRHAVLQAYCASAPAVVLACSGRRQWPSTGNTMFWQTPVALYMHSE